MENKLLKKIRIEKCCNRRATLVKGLEGDLEKITDIASKLKCRFHCGGTCQEHGTIMLQGLHDEKELERAILSII